MTADRKPRALIFIVAYYAESTIMNVLERIPALEGYEVEVLIIDDSSKDATYALADQLRRLGADDMGAVDFARLGIGDDLHKPIALRRRHGLAGSGERELADLVIESFFLRRLLGETRARDLRLAIRAAWKVLHALRMTVVEHAVDGIDRFKRRDMCEPRRQIGRAHV